MDKKIKVLDVTIDNYTAKEAMQKVVSYMETEPMNVVEIVTLSMLSQFLHNEDNASYMKEFDLTFAGNKAILEAAGVKDARCLKEADSLLFVKMMLRYLHKNRKRVLLFAENQSSLEKVQEYLEEKYSGIVICETATLEEHGKSDDMIVNRINGAEADCVIATLPSPIQEEIVIRNRMLLNARIWIALGSELHETESRKFGRTWFRNFFTKFIMKKIIRKELEKNETL